jgi:hypothetical protein
MLRWIIYNGYPPFLLKSAKKFGFLKKILYLCTMKHKVDIEEIKQRLVKEKEKRAAERVERFNRLKPFETVDDIPDIPKVNDPRIYEEVIVKNLIRCGAIPKDKLEVGATYEGNCRNFEQARWDGKVFWGKRYKFGEWREDKINHFQDDNGYDLFVPIKKVL